jgi:biotin-(acetyl-CoA carboxylase) ligase
LRSGTRLHEGLAESLDEDGQLLMRAGDGSAESFNAGEVTVVGSQVIS